MIPDSEPIQALGADADPGSREASTAPSVPPDALLIVPVRSFVLFPGVNPEEVQTGIEDGALVLVGHRVLPAELRVAVIHRLELPQGRFERRVPLPAGRYSGVRQASVNGCLVVSLHKAG